MLAEFASSVEAVRCSIDIQHQLSEINTRLPENRRMLVRIGINFGDVVVKDDNLYGDSVNVAARMESIAPPGGIAVSSDIYRQVYRKIAPPVRGSRRAGVKNIAEPIHVYSI